MKRVNPNDEFNTEVPPKTNVPLDASAARTVPDEFCHCCKSAVWDAAPWIVKPINAVPAVGIVTLDAPPLN